MYGTTGGSPIDGANFAPRGGRVAVSEQVWICRDLSNGDGADGRPKPTYVWAFPSRRLARDGRRTHSLSRKMAQLGPVECWPLSTLRKLYTRVGDTVLFTGDYYVRRDR